MPHLRSERQRTDKIPRFRGRYKRANAINHSFTTLHVCIGKTRCLGGRLMDGAALGLGHQT
jgi:hypothetical protein